MQLLAQGRVIRTIYLPYFNGDNQYINAYSETLVILQRVINLNETSAMVTVRGMNAPGHTAALTFVGQTGLIHVS